ncbi:MAG TPA: tetratricopeptide repeat protein [Acetobacteraceae bacterium]|nr:tetratricopeptide repeat protein [Acetobacteraceae bacterium]
MYQDALGLPLTTESVEAARAFDHAVAGYLTYRADAMQRVSALLETDPDCGMAHVLKGYFGMLAFKQTALPIAQQAAADAGAKLSAATLREQAHLAALQAWLALEPERAVSIWNLILDDHPRDILAFRLAHFVNFWLGRPAAMLASAEAVSLHWGEELPGYNAILGCICFANEECGRYMQAEEAGRTAIALDPGDLWSAHGVAHVMEMQGRRGEGLIWVESLAPHWDGSNNLRHHLWWHAALFKLEHGDHAGVLALYDRQFRDRSSPLVEAQPDLYIDVQNAASMLWRLVRHGVDVGDRWAELADKAEARIGDCLSAFTLPHWMMALAATGRFETAQRMLAAMRDFAQGPGSLRKLVGEIALPVTEAVLMHARGDYARAVAAMRPMLSAMYQLGGSHAQQDALEQLYLDAAVQAGLQDDIRLLLERVAGRHPVPPSRRVGYAAAARAVGF